MAHREKNASEEGIGVPFQIESLVIILPHSARFVKSWRRIPRLECQSIRIVRNSCGAGCLGRIHPQTFGGPSDGELNRRPSVEKRRGLAEPLLLAFRCGGLGVRRWLAG